MKLSYDLHTHILPGVDDGAKTIDDALVLIKALSEQGVKNICLTPHFYTHRESVEDFLSHRDEAAKKFLPCVPEGISIKLGAEVYVTKYLFSEERDLTPLCIDGTPFMITEFSYNSHFSDNTMRMIHILLDRGIIPVIPHIERYSYLMKHKYIIAELIDLGVIIQSNAFSFTQFSTKRKLLKLLKDGYIHVLSSDTHSLTRNSPCTVSQAIAYISSKLGDMAVSQLEQNAQKVFYADK